METSKSAPASPAASPPSHHPPVTRAQAQSQQPSLDLIIGDCMERLGTRIGLLESELRYAWRALDLLSQEYLKMWERLEKLELLLCEQQGVISQLIDFYTAVESGEVIAGGCSIEEADSGGSCMDLVPAHAHAIVTDSALAISSTTDALISELKLKMGVDDINLPDEAFYRSLNNAYRNDLVSTMHPPVAAMGASQLGMIWEEPEEDSNGNGRRDEQKYRAEELYSTVDFRGSSPCPTDQDIHQLTDLSSMDQAAIEKLKELDLLTTKLQKDSRNLKELQDRLLCESPNRKYLRDSCDSDPSTQGANELDEQISRMYEESGIDNWSFRDDQDDLLLKEQYETEIKDDLMHGISYSTTKLVPTPISPRKRVEDDLFDTNTLEHSSPMSLREANRSLPSSPKFKENGHTSPYKGLSLDRTEPEFDMACNIYQESTISESDSSIRIRQETYVAPIQDLILDLTEPEPSISGSPPPPAPQDCAYLIPGGALVDENSVHLYSATEGLTVTNVDQPGSTSQRTPHSPKSPRTSPKHVNKSSAKLASAKSDSGLSSMSGWSSLEKSPGSPKAANKASAQHGETSSHLLHARNQLQGPIGTQGVPHNRAYPTISVHPTESKEPAGSSSFRENDNGYNGILPGGHLASSFTPVHTPTNIREGAQESFVPPPAPDASGMSKRRHKSFEYEPHSSECSFDFPFQNERPPAIYSVAGSNRQQYFTSVYTSKSAGVSVNVPTYPDLIGHYIQDQYGDVQTDQGMFLYDQKKAYPVSYTTVVPNTKRPLQRVHSTGSAPAHQFPISEGIANFEACKTAMYQSMFPTGNLTDALTYYPTPSANVYTHLHQSGQPMGPKIGYHDQWGYEAANVDLSRESSASTIRSAASTVQEMSYDRYVDSRTPPKKPIRSDLSGSHQAQQHLQTGWIPPGEENTRIVMEQRPNVVPDLRLKQNDYCDPNNVIVSQSGYISFSSDLKEVQPDDKVRKPKKHATLKHAMSQVSHWLPDLHLPKRHRSYSLPSGVRREDLIKSKEANRTREPQTINSTNRKKKKHNLVSTMSGILQKAKRKGYGIHSMSDPEQSEPEWGSGRHSGVSDSEDSAYSDITKERAPSKIIRQNSAPPRPPQPLQIPPKLLQCQQSSLPIPSYMQTSEDDMSSSTNVTSFQHQQVASPAAQGAPLFAKMQVSTRQENEQETEEGLPELSYQKQQNVENQAISYEDEDTGNIFQTVGEAKKTFNTSKEEPASDHETVPPVSVVPASREFAVSRALGKYRRRQSSTTSEDENQRTDEMFQVMTQDEEEEEMRRNEIFERISFEESSRIPQSASQPESIPITENNSVNHSRGHGRFAPPRQQQSLEIPWQGRGSGDTDDDNRSTHSWRSTSRVSSRRQSTEDSIDSEDEWYCYELRKLEEMEKGGIPVFAELPHDDEKVIMVAQQRAKQQMSSVLHELSIKIQPKRDIVEERELAEAERAAQLERKESVASSKLLMDDDASSGATSGPDSPDHQSGDEIEELESDNEDRRNSVREARGSVQDSNKSYFSESPTGEPLDNMPDDYPDDEEIEREDLVPGTPSLPRFKFDQPPQSFSPPPPGSKEDLSEPGLPGGVPKGAAVGKWKLLKALKERKAEEKSQEAEKKEAAATTTTTT